MEIDGDVLNKKVGSNVKSSQETKKNRTVQLKPSSWVTA